MRLVSLAKRICPTNGLSIKTLETDTIITLTSATALLKSMKRGRYDSSCGKHADRQIAERLVLTAIELNSAPRITLQKCSHSEREPSTVHGMTSRQDFANEAKNFGEHVIDKLLARSRRGCLIEDRTIDWNRTKHD